MTQHHLKRLSLDELDDVSGVFDELVLQTEGIDHFCSSSDWCLPAAQGLMPPRESFIFFDDDVGYAFMRTHNANGLRVLEPLESMWGLGTPIVGRGRLRVQIFFDLLECISSDWDAVFVTGIPLESELQTELIQILSSKWRLGLGPSVKRDVASLQGGIDAYQARRSRTHRKRLRRLLKMTDIEFEWDHNDNVDSMVQRVLNIERRSWKGIEGVGLEGGSMVEFYRLMIRRLLPKGRLRLMFAKHDGIDVAYVLGAVWNGVYRGLQFAYDDSYKNYGLGHRCQFEQIQRLCDEGVETYDLGTSGLEYKHAWSDEVFETSSMIVFNRAS